MVTRCVEAMEGKNIRYRGIRARSEDPSTDDERTGAGLRSMVFKMGVRLEIVAHGEHYILVF